MEKRICTRCREEKPITEFYRKRVGTWEGYFAQCKECIKEQSRERYSTPEYREWNRNRMKENSDYYRDHHRKWREENPHKESVLTSKERRARLNVQNAVNRGDIIKPSYCEECRKSCSPQSHHEDYNKPLQIEWLCTSCHGKRHRIEGY